MPQTLCICFQVCAEIGLGSVGVGVFDDLIKYYVYLFKSKAGKKLGACKCWELERSDGTRKRGGF